MNMVEHEKRLADAVEEIRRYCNYCGHSQLIPRYRISCICSQCGCTVYRDDKTEFKEIMKAKLIKKNEDSRLRSRR